MTELDTVARLRGIATRLIASLDVPAIEDGLFLHELADTMTLQAHREIGRGWRFRARQRRGVGLARLVVRVRDLVRGAA